MAMKLRFLGGDSLSMWFDVDAKCISGEPSGIGMLVAPVEDEPFISENRRMFANRGDDSGPELPPALAASSRGLGERMGTPSFSRSSGGSTLAPSMPKFMSIGEGDLASFCAANARTDETIGEEGGGPAGLGAPARMNAPESIPPEPEPEPELEFEPVLLDELLRCRRGVPSPATGPCGVSISTALGPASPPWKEEEEAASRLGEPCRSGGAGCREGIPSEEAGLMSATPPVTGDVSRCRRLLSPAPALFCDVLLPLGPAKKFEKEGEDPSPPLLLPPRSGSTLALRKNSPDRRLPPVFSPGPDGKAVEEEAAEGRPLSCGGGSVMPRMSGLLLSARTSRRGEPPLAPSALAFALPELLLPACERPTLRYAVMRGEVEGDELAEEGPELVPVLFACCGGQTESQGWDLSGFEGTVCPYACSSGDGERAGDCDALPGASCCCWSRWWW